jgi:hypothetical protein
MRRRNDAGRWPSRSQQPSGRSRLRRDDEANTSSTGTAEAEEFTASITTLEGGAVIDAGDIYVAVDVGDFKVVDKLGLAPEAGEGHVER